MESKSLNRCETTFDLVVARSLNNVIGNGEKIPWKVRGEQKLFRNITMGGVLIMGRKTFQSIGRPLPGRTSIVVTRNTGLTFPSCEVATSLPVAIRMAGEYAKPVFVIGGGEIYRQALPLAAGVHITTIECEVEGDVSFPEFPTGEFSLQEEKTYHSNINYLYQYYSRKESP